MPMIRRYGTSMATLDDDGGVALDTRMSHCRRRGAGVEHVRRRNSRERGVPRAAAAEAIPRDDCPSDPFICSA